MASLQDRLDANLRKRREAGPWSTDDEARWLTRHPNDAGTPHAPFIDAPTEEVVSPLTTSTTDEPTPTFDADLIPDISGDTATSAESDQITDLLDNLGIVAAYQRWCGKSKVKAGGRTESIKVSCPNPAHPDKDPSAWLNTEKNLWHCGACGFGGDIYDIAAWHFGYPVPGYKDGKQFVDLRVQMAGDLGYVVVKKGDHTYIEEAEPIVQTEEPAQPAPPEPAADSEPSPAEEPKTEEAPSEPSPTPAPAPVEPARPDGDAPPVRDADEVDTPLEKPEVPPLASVTPIRPDFLEVMEDSPDHLTPEEISDLTIDWREFVPRDTFLREWMEATSPQDIPNEYYFWDGLLALGLACGRECYLGDVPPVFFNLYVVHYGPTGAGKSRSTNTTIQLLRDALPYQETDDYPTGTQIISGVGSGEALLDSFNKPVIDPGTMGVVDHASVRGLLKFDELESLIQHSRRAGNVTRPIMMEMFDGASKVESRTRTSGVVVAEKPFATAISTTQPKAVRRLLSSNDADSGFVNRWIFAYGPPVKRMSFGRAALDLDDSVRRLKDVRNWAHKRGAMPMAPKAMRLWDEYFHTSVAPIMEEDDSGIFTRYDLVLKKLMGIFAVNSLHPQVQEDDFHLMLKLTKPILRTYAMLGAKVGLGDIDDTRQRILKIVHNFTAKHDGKKYPAMRDIKRALSGSRIPAETLNKTIKIMMELDDLEEIVHKPARGPSTTTYRPVGLGETS